MRRLALLWGLILTLFFTVGAAPARAEAVPAEVNGDYKLLALTFDDGPSSYTTELLDGLAARGAHCTFFMVGRNAAQRPQLLERMVAEGHQLGNHSYNHAQLTAANVAKQISDCRSYLVAAGGEQVYYVRPPYGSSDETIRASFNAPSILWSVDPLDWKYRNTNTVVNNILSKVKDGDIILLHDLYKTSVDAALIVIDELQAQGYEFVTVSELFRRRGVVPQNGKSYNSARNKGVNLGPNPEYFDESQLTEHWAYASIQYALEKGWLLPGADGSIRPNVRMTREDFIFALGKLLAVEPPALTAPPFPDVAVDAPAAPYIAWAAACGIVDGYGDEQVIFGVGDGITCEQMAQIIMSCLGQYGYAIGDYAGWQLNYKDAAAISAYALPGVRYCTGAGLLTGNDDGYLRPQAYVTRGQAAAILVRLQNYLNVN